MHTVLCTTTDKIWEFRTEHHTLEQKNILPDERYSSLTFNSLAHCVKFYQETMLLICIYLSQYRLEHTFEIHKKSN